MIKQIQILRLVAAVWVAIFHGSALGIFADIAPSVDFVIKMGYAGVDIFFVVSGVIMAHSTKNTTYGLRAAGAFCLTRFSRIYTGWWPALLLYIIFFKITQQLHSQIDFQESFYLYFTDLTGLINIAIWSLMFELYFYVLIAIGLLLPLAQRQAFLKLLFGILVVVNIYFFSSRAGADADMQRDWIKIFYVAPIVAEFFMGYFLYHYLQTHQRSSWQKWGLLAAVLIALLVYVEPHFEDHSYGLANFYYWPERAVLIGGTAVAIVGLAMTLPSPRSKITLLMAKFGDYSYAIYLLHILAFNMMLVLLPWNSLSSQLHLIIAAGVLLALLFVSALYYHAVEHPLYLFCRGNINRWFSLPSSDGPPVNRLYKNQQTR